MAVALSAAWIRPTSTELEDFVERRSERDELRSIVTDHLDSLNRQCWILVTGDRGIGKSILSRTVVAELQTERPDLVVAIVVDGRAITFRRCLKDMAAQLVERLRPLIDVGAAGTRVTWRVGSTSWPSSPATTRSAVRRQKRWPESTGRMRPWRADYSGS